MEDRRSRSCYRRTIEMQVSITFEVDNAVFED
jgi:hypothetical protein